MKTMKHLILFFIGLCLISACNKDNQLLVPDNGLKSQNDAFACGKIFKVHAIEGTDITDGLKQAFEDAKAAKEECCGMDIDGRKIRVDYSITTRAHTPTPGVYMGRPTGYGFILNLITS